MLIETLVNSSDKKEIEIGGSDRDFEWKVMSNYREQKPFLPAYNQDKRIFVYLLKSLKYMKCSDIL